jgi:death-on-curing family protein
VLELANEFELDLDETLVILWEAGFEDVLDITSRIPARDGASARRALGIGTVREMRTVAYWREELGLDADKFHTRLSEMGISLSPATRMLPKGALAKLRRNAREINTTPWPRGEDGAVTASRLTVPPEIETPCEWRIAGTSRQCQHLTLEEVLQIHNQLEMEFAAAADPILPAGVRDAALLDSAVHRAQTSLGGQRKYDTAEGVSAALLHSLIHNHPFFNGNKRTALVAALVSLDRNNILLTSSEHALFRYVLKVAQHGIVPKHWSMRADREVMEIADWIYKNSRAIEKGERSIKWRELRKILTRLGCSIEGPYSGNKMKIRRTDPRKRLLRLKSNRELIAHARCGGDGREVGQDHLHHIRDELKLDDQHGYDSACFYGTDPREPDEFISEYRNILRRLARL